MLDQRSTHYSSTSIWKMYLDTNICFHVGLPITSNNGKLTIPMPRSKSIMIEIYILPLQKSWNSLIASWTKCGVVNVVCLRLIIWCCKWMSIQIRRSTKLCKSASINIVEGFSGYFCQNVLCLWNLSYRLHIIIVTPFVSVNFIAWL